MNMARHSSASDARQDGPVFRLDGRSPTLAADVFVAPTAAITGDVSIGSGSSVWFSAVVRGDEEPVRIGSNCNVQDGAIIHSSCGETPTTVGDNVTIGHGAILHGCTIADGAMVGIGAVVLDGAVVGEGAIVAACALVPPNKHVPPGQLWVGNPGGVRRHVSDAERASLAENADDYRTLAELHIRDGIGAGYGK